MISSFLSSRPELHASGVMRARAIAIARRAVSPTVSIGGERGSRDGDAERILGMEIEPYVPSSLTPSWTPVMKVTVWRSSGSRRITASAVGDVGSPVWRTAEMSSSPPAV